MALVKEKMESALRLDVPLVVDARIGANWAAVALRIEPGGQRVPLYEYQCPKCGNFDKIRKFSDPPLKKCPTCGSPVAKLLSAPAIQFKGAGWYVNDYAKKAKGGEAKGCAK